MEYKDEMHMKADTENIPEAQEAPQKQAATESEQETKERVPIGRRILNDIRNAFSPERRKKSAIITAAVVLVMAAAGGLLGRSGPAPVAKQNAIAVFDDMKTVVKLSAYDWQKDRLADYKDEDDFFEEMSGKYDEDITSWRTFYKAVDRDSREDLEDALGKYKISAEVTKNRDVSLNKWLDEYSLTLKELERSGSFDKDKVSGVKEVAVKVKLKGEDQTKRVTMDMCLVKTGGFWKVLTCDMDWD